MNDIHFLKPKLKKRSYISETKKKISYHIYDVKIKNYYRITSASNALKLSVNIDKNDYFTFFNDIDNIALNNIINKNKKWFDNELSEEELNTFFKTSICSQNKILDLVLSSSSIIKYNNITIDELDANLHKLLLKKNCLFSIKVELIGMYIYKDKIQNKWSIKEIEIIDQEDNDNLQVSIKELNDEWNTTLNETIITLNEELERYNKRKNDIETFISINKDLINTIKMCKNKDNIWENKISILKNNIKNIISF
jgi:hypothetical protein